MQHLDTRSPLEQAFDFEDPHFRDYIANHSRSPDQFMKMSDQMGTNDHPLVRYAAGWAAAEAALFRGRKGRNSGKLETRLGYLSQASEHWLGAGEEMSDLRRAQSTERKNLDVRDTGVRLVQSLSYLPLMEVAASWLAYEPLDDEVTEAKFQKVRSGCLELGSGVMALPSKTTQERESRSGLATEMAYGLVSQLDEPQRYLTLPASFRQEHNRFSAKMRADYIAVSAGDSHKKVLVQLKSGNRRYNEAYKKDVVYFYGQDDLVIRSTDGPIDTLNMFLKAEAGKVSKNTAAKLRVLSRVVSMRLDDFQGVREKRDARHLARG